MGMYQKFSLIENMITLRESDIFSTLTPTELQKVVGIVKEYHCKKGEILVTQGDKQFNLFIIQEGKVEYIVDEKGASIVIDERGVNSHFGELSTFIEDYRSPYTIKVIEDCKLLGIPKNDFYEILLNNPTSAVKLLEIFAQEIYTAGETISNLVKSG